MVRRDEVVLVDQSGIDLPDVNGRPRTMAKVEAHRQGALHRAVSVFIFNDKNEVLLQKRSATKYHSPSKWTNTCCTHPLPDEKPMVAARRRLLEEMSFVVPLTEAFTFVYRADVGGGLTENEFDHVSIGVFNSNPIPNPDEVSDWKWVALDELKQDLNENPDKYTPWFRQCFDRVIMHRSQNGGR